MPYISVSTEAINSAANGAEQVANAVSQANIQGPLANAGAAAPGSKNAGTAQDLAQKMIGDMQAMAGDIQAFGGRLHGAANAYVSADANAAAPFTGGR